METTADAGGGVGSREGNRPCCAVGYENGGFVISLLVRSSTRIVSTETCQGLLARPRVSRDRARHGDMFAALTGSSRVRLTASAGVAWDS